jgi:arylsulfatase A-like enzyme
MAALSDGSTASGNQISAMAMFYVSRAAGAAILITALSVVACGRPHFVVGPELTAVRGEARDSRLTENVLVVSIDGLRPDAIAVFKAPTLERLVSEGSYTFSARTIMPSKTLPSHTSMLTGEPPDDHGVLWNNVTEAAPGPIEIPTVFSEAREHGYTTAAFFSKAKFSHLQKPGSLDYSQAPGGWFGRWSAAETMGDVERHLKKSKPNLLFVHLPDPDSEGHSNGWMSAAYGRGVLRADAAVGRLIAAADDAYGEGKYTIIVTADHGGHDRSHGSDNPHDVTIPWIAWGRGVTPGELPADMVQTMDTASTVLFLLGVDQPSAWAGAAVMKAFADNANAAQ